MEMELRVAGRKVALSKDISSFIRREAAKLEHFYGRIIGCRVLVEAEHRFPTGGAVNYAVKLDLTVPQGKLPTTRQSDRDLWTAVQRAFEAGRRQLEDYARVQRGDTGTPAESPLARVRTVFPWEGYGFLETADGREVYFHRNSVLDRGFDRLEPGTEVRFAEEMGDQGPQATSVVAVSRRRARRGRAPER